MIRPLALGFCLLEIVAPRRLAEAGERIALENPGDGRLRSWTLPMARLEGLVVLWLLVRDDRSLADLRLPLGIFGVVMTLAPRGTLEFGLELAYENPDDLRVKSWVRLATRLLGACYLALGLLAGRADTPEETAA